MARPNGAAFIVNNHYTPARQNVIYFSAAENVRCRACARLKKRIREAVPDGNRLSFRMQQFAQPGQVTGRTFRAIVKSAYEHEFVVYRVSAGAAAHA